MDISPGPPLATTKPKRGGKPGDKRVRRGGIARQASSKVTHLLGKKKGVRATLAKAEMRTAFLQLSRDLSTLRWSWKDFLLVEDLAEIALTNPNAPPHKQTSLILSHGPLWRRKRLEVNFGSRAACPGSGDAVSAICVRGAGG